MKETKAKRRGRPRKESPTPNGPTPNPDDPTQPLNPRSEPAESNSEQSALDVEVQGHESQPEESGFGAMLKRAGSRLLEDSDEIKTETRGRKSKKANQEEFNTLVIAVLTLILSFSKIPQNVKPNENEIYIFSNHLSGIMIRHLPIAKGLSADALDIIGLFAVMSTYYARIAPELKTIAPQEKRQVQAPAPVENKTIDPIQRKSAAASDFLEAAQNKVVAE